MYFLLLMMTPSRAIDVLDVHPEVTSKLKNARITQLTHVVLRSSTELQHVSKLSDAQLSAVKEQAAKHVYPIVEQSAFDKLGTEKDKIPTLCDPIDKLLKGGLLCQGINEISGESATGKTQLCLQLSLSCQLVKRNGKYCNSVYICTEDVFPSQRIHQMSRLLSTRLELPSHKFTDHVLVEHVSDKNQLLATLENRLPVLLEKGQTNLVVIDSITAVFRGQEENQSMSSRSKDVASLGVQLHLLAEKYRICIVCVNQVSADMTPGSTETSQPALGLTWSNLVTTRLQLSRPSANTMLRTMTVKFAPHLEPNYCGYMIQAQGLVPVDNSETAHEGFFGGSSSS